MVGAGEPLEQDPDGTQASPLECLLRQLELGLGLGLGLGLALWYVSSGVLDWALLICVQALCVRALDRMRERASHAPQHDISVSIFVRLWAGPSR